MWACSIHAQNARFENLWIDDGLPGKAVWSIAQDSHGFVWTGGTNGIARHDGIRFQAFPFPETDGEFPPGTVVRSMVVDDADNIWVGTLRNGLYRATPYTRGENSTLVKWPTHGSAIRALVLVGDALFVGTESGLERIPVGAAKAQSQLLETQNVTSLAMHSGATLLIGTRDQGLFQYSLERETTSPIVEGVIGESPIYFIHVRRDRSILAGTDLGIASISADFDTTVLPDFGLGKVFWSAISLGDETWLGSRDFGVFRVAGDRVLETYNHDPGRPKSLSDSSVTTMALDRSGTLWLGTFSGGLNRLDPDTLQFGWHDATSTGYSCLSESGVHSFYPESTSTLWIGTVSGLIRTNATTGECESASTPGTQILGFHRDSADQLWVSTSLGLSRVDESNGLQVEKPVKEHFSFFVRESGTDTLIYGTAEGLFEFNVPERAVRQIPLNSETTQPMVMASSQDVSGTFWFATSGGIYRWSPGHSPEMMDTSDRLPSQFVEAIAVRGNTVWAGGRTNGLIGFDVDTSSTLHHLPVDTVGRVVGIVEGNAEDLWVSTASGLFQYKPDSGALRRYTARDGLQSDAFVAGAAAAGEDGQLYFGGPRGWNVFQPSQITANTVRPEVSLAGFTRFNQRVSTVPGSDNYALKSSIELQEPVELSHNDDRFGIEFAALHFADPSRNRLEYKMEGFETEWTPAHPGERSATYTNLPWGDYVFRVRAANKDGLWNLDGISLPITVQTPIWARWWALVVYFLLLVSLAMAFAYLRSAAAIRRADELQVTVNERTRELAERNQRVEEQKSTIEDLLRRKDSLFANVSHEFRTPLTLILGPLDDLISGAEGDTQKSMFRRIRRNAERLLHLVDQLLFLARTSTRVSQKRESIQLQETVDYLASSFRPLAQKKRLCMNIEILQPSRTFAIPDAVETMVSNLLSNAIKYTPQGGTVTLRLYHSDGFARLEVEDSGAGMSAAEKSQIFERFTRLPEHQELQGTGIGLALVRELAEAHGGEIEVDSQPGQGSVFSLLLPLADDDESLQIASAAEPVDETVVNTPRSGIRSKPKVLVIDDDYDMLSYVTECLASDFRCVTAVNGKQGLEKALDVVPDLVVSDVMMPEMDGFELSKRIREDERLSHIPIVLLTARGGRDSRIKAWDMYVDDYIVKPFHADELRSRLHSLLNVRVLLRNQVRSDLTEEGASTSLNKKEQAFVDRLTAVIERRYSEFGLTRADLAGEMAVSERQLQRKLKAITDQNPSEFLREFRLRKARDLLADGEQVTLTSEKCGFASPSQFGFAFKKRYGTTPKKFQMGEQSKV